METMNIALPDELKEYVRERIGNGGYSSVSEYVRELIRNAHTVAVMCRLDKSPTEFRPGMTGHARIYTHHGTVGQIALERTLRFLRTEFWW
jgi:hypothetical protein